VIKVYKITLKGLGIILGVIIGSLIPIAIAGTDFVIGEINWDNGSYFITDRALVQITDPDENTSPTTRESFEIDVWGDSDAGGIDLFVSETAVNSGIFQGIVLFTDTEESHDNILRVSEGDVITAEYEDQTLPPPFSPGSELDITDTATIKIGEGPPPTEPPEDPVKGLFKKIKKVFKNIEEILGVDVTPGGLFGKLNNFLRDLRQDLDQLQEDVANIQGGISGPQGPVGPQGPKGDAGPSGKTGGDGSHVIVLGRLTASFNPEFGCYGGGVAGKPLSGCSTVVPVNGQLTNLVVSAPEGSPGIDTGYIITIMKNGAATDLSCTISDDETACTNKSKIVNVIAGDILDVRGEKINNPARIEIITSLVLET